MNKADERLDEFVEMNKKIMSLISEENYYYKLLKDQNRILEAMKSENRIKWIMPLTHIDFNIDKLILNEVGR